MRLATLVAMAVTLSAVLSAGARAAPVLMISIDGLRAEDVTQPDKHGLKIPNLRSLVASGVSVEGVRGVLPTLTYPSHTTLITGVHPSKHGIGGNVAFDPTGRNQGGWMWYAQDIKVPTLWDAVKAKNGKIASIAWPVSTGKHEIDYHIPEYWRARTEDDGKLIRALSTPGLPEELEQATGLPLLHVALRYDDRDGTRMVWGAEMVARYKPQLTMVHLTSLDDARHAHGPDSPEAKAALEHIDSALKPMIDKARAAMPDLVVAIVSDHGFSHASKALNLRAALAAEGLLEQNSNGNVVSWDAVAWLASGSAAIVLKDPTDQVVASRVKRMLDRLARDPANGIAQVLDRQVIAELGGTPDASFWVAMKDGFSVIENASPEIVQDVKYKGAHGFSPVNDKLLTAFIVSGPSIANKRLGLIDLRDIAPTMGEILGAPLPRHDGQILPVAGK